MTRYAIGEDRNELMAAWETGYGAVARPVASLPTELSVQQRRTLAAELSGLSDALWRCYTHPATAADSLAVNSEGWRREQLRKAFVSVVDDIRKPNLPDADGNLMVSYNRVEERAHRVGRCLYRASDGELTALVIGDVEAELAAVERAELGDLSGRSVQAVQLTRQDASPVQVAAADQILENDPLGGDELFFELDPTSACVAAAHWLQAAADVVSGASGIEAGDVLVEADNIEPLPHATPTAVLELLERGMSPLVAVTSLIRDAMAVAEGAVADLGALRDKFEETEGDERYEGNDRETVEEMTKIRLTTLDPQRPARDMLEDLLTGIRGCWLLYREHAYTPGLGADGDDPDLSDNEIDGRVDAAFCQAVRAQAAAERYRLGFEPPPKSV